MSVALPVHPFPARMAPELALERLPRRLDDGLHVLDPMMGSGTLPVLAALQGYRAIGIDSDPLAVLIARTNGRRLPPDYAEAADRVVEYARAASRAAWEHVDPDTQAFIDYWFDPVAQRRLGALARQIATAHPGVRDQLWCAFSRLIITKDAGASRARDVSHSRPHRVREAASFNPIERFAEAVAAIAKRHRLIGISRPSAARLRLIRGDARRLPVKSESIDIVMTSPPYLQAIDYLRGHRMSLVWMGYSVDELRSLRSESIGTERGADLDQRYEHVLRAAVTGSLSRRAERIVAQYLTDMGQALREIHRVLRVGGQATLVVADARLGGVAVSIATIIREVAAVEQLACVSHTRRAIPAGSRYLPPPVDGGSNSLDGRMRTEHCITFAKSA